MLSRATARHKAAAAALAAATLLAAGTAASCELIDDMREFSTEQMRREDERRLALVADVLAQELERRGLAPGRGIVSRCWVQKVSNLILNINLELRDAATGQTLDVGSVDIRGNTDESWRRGARRLAENLEERRRSRR